MEAEENNLIYAPFWRRFLAFLIDYLILAVFTLFWTIPFVHILFLKNLRLLPPKPKEQFVQIMNYSNNGLFNSVSNLLIYFFVTASLITILIAWIYFAAMESSKKQATLGKLTFGIKVTGLSGERITFGKATLRFFARFISAFPLGAGFLMALFTNKKQALHDLLAETLVLES